MILPHNISRQTIVRHAESWVGTRYHSNAMVKCVRGPRGQIIQQGGVDCAMIMLGIFGPSGVGYVQDLEVPEYRPDWFQHNGVEKYLNVVIAHTREITEAEALPGDIVLYKWGRLFAHGAIIVNPGWPHIVHAHSEAYSVQFDRGDSGRLVDRERRFFTIFPEASA